MTLEEVLPLLREGKSITRTRKSYNQASMIVWFVSGTKLNCKFLYKSGKEFNDYHYKFSNEDLIADDWEIVYNWDILDDYEIVE